MEKLPDTLHSIMARFLDDDCAKDAAFIDGGIAAIGDIRELAKTNLVYINDKDFNSERYLELTEEGEDYRRAFFPTKDEQIEDLKAVLQDIFDEAPYLSHAYTTAYKALTGKKFKE